MVAEIIIWLFKLLIIMYFLIFELRYFWDFFSGLRLKFRQEDYLIEWHYSKEEWKTFLKKNWFFFPPILYIIRTILASQPNVIIYKNGLSFNGLKFPLIKESITEPVTRSYTVRKIYKKNIKGVNSLVFNYFDFRSSIPSTSELNIPIPAGITDTDINIIIEYFYNPFEARS
ncbi:hypothetical protein SPFL3102_03513 [Sporomusaceae bacterium FL31]|nr:hypothetical protein SPFL3101_02386 [Sporomusaceae bacterium FL31]GCE35662.1 hypothetical protein SPFL3102_03513 [Sporomusaceae bacterium]